MAPNYSKLAQALFVHELSLTVILIFLEGGVNESTASWCRISYTDNSNKVHIVIWYGLHHGGLFCNTVWINPFKSVLSKPPDIFTEFCGNSAMPLFHCESPAAVAWIAPRVGGKKITPLPPPAPPPPRAYGIRPLRLPALLVCRAYGFTALESEKTLVVVHRQRLCYLYNPYS